MDLPIFNVIAEGKAIGDSLLPLAQKIILMACILKAGVSFAKGFATGRMDYIGMIGIFTPYFVIFWWMTIQSYMLGVNSTVKTNAFEGGQKLYEAVISKYQKEFQKSKQADQVYNEFIVDNVKSMQSGLDDSYLFRGMYLGSGLTELVQSDSFYFVYEVFINPVGSFFRNFTFLFEMLLITFIILVRMVMIFLSDFILAMLYAIGPLAFGLSVIPGFDGLRHSWFSRWLNVTCWMITISIFDVFTVKVVEWLATVNSTYSVDYLSLFTNASNLGKGLINLLRELAYFIVLLVMYMSVPFFTAFYTEASNSASFLAKTVGAAIAATTMGGAAIGAKMMSVKAGAEADKLGKQAESLKSSAGGADQLKSQAGSFRQQGDDASRSESDYRSQANDYRQQASMETGRGNFDKAQEMSDKAAEADQKADGFADQKFKNYRAADQAENLSSKLNSQAENLQGQGSKIKEGAKERGRQRIKQNLDRIKTVALYEAFD